MNNLNKMKKNLLLIMLSFLSIVFSQTTHIVNSGAYYYSPSELIIDQGDTVVWINDGGTHDVNGDLNSITSEPFNNPVTFDSPATSVAGAEIFTFIFNVPGLYNYDCSVGSHAINGMVGSIIVNEVNEIVDCVDNDASAVALASMWNPDITGCSDAVPYFELVGYPCSTDLSVLGMSGTIADICECSCAQTTIVDIIVDSESHNTLEAAVIAAELADDLSGDGPFTVFAPTDAAFDALPVGTVESLLVDPTGDLANILLHHVYSGSALSTDLSDGMMIPTLFGTELEVTFTSDGVMIDNAMVTVADITADNGVVHVIDAVLIPGSTSINENNFHKDKYNYSVDLNGQLINQFDKNRIIIDVFESGKTEKKLIIK